jgi:oligogalacturonide lyase
MRSGGPERAATLGSAHPAGYTCPPCAPPPTLRHARRLTTGRANDQLLYFTSSSLTADDRTLVFLSDRDSPVPHTPDPRASVNLYALDRASGAVRRLTDNDEGYLRSYVYFDGRPYRGLGLASPSLHPASGEVYYLQGRELRRAIAELPADQVTGFTHVSDDNTRVCVPTIHEAAFADLRAIDATVQRRGLAGHIRVFDTRTGQQVRDVAGERGWVTHVQFRPGSRDAILFNHEWPADCGIRRVWLWDGERVRRLRPEGANADGTPRRREDWVCHEVWSRDGRHVLYHGKYASGGAAASGRTPGRSFVGRVSPAGDDHVEVAFAPHLRRYGHFTPSADPGLLVSDGYAEFPHLAPGAAAGVAAEGHGEWISLLYVDWARGAHRWVPLCRHGSSWAGQDAHPHPIFDHAGAEVLFTSDRGGRRAIYAVALTGEPAPAYGARSRAHRTSST